MNPYWGQDFFSFLALFFGRLLQLFFGKLSFSELASDEIQIFVLFFVGVSAALVGVFLVLKKMTMLANALSHTILLGIVISYLFMQVIIGKGLLVFDNKLLLFASLITALLTMGLTDLCKRVFKLQEDASIGLIFTFLFAIGVVLVTIYTRNVHLGSEAIMGNIDALHINDLKFTFSIACVNLIMILAFFKYYQILAFDEVLAKLLCCFPLFFQYLLLIQTSCTAIGAFRAVGVFLFLIFLTAPILSARLFTKKLKTIVAYAVLINFITIVFSVALSRHLLSVYDISISTAGLTCVCSALFYPFSLLGVKIKMMLLKSLQKRNLALHNLNKAAK